MAEAGEDGENYAREKSRRIVARSALKRASAMVQEWQQDEREKRVLAVRIAIGLGLFSVFALAVFLYRYR